MTTEQRVSILERRDRPATLFHFEFRMLVVSPQIHHYVLSFLNIWYCTIEQTSSSKFFSKNCCKRIKYVYFAVIPVNGILHGFCATRANKGL